MMASKVKKRPMVRINTGDTSIDKVWAHYKNPQKFKLTPHQEEVKQRWVSAWKLLSKKKYKTKVANILTDMYGVSKAQAFRDIRNSEKLFGKALKSDRDGQLALLYQFALEGYKEAMKAQDYKVAKSFHDSMMSCLPKEDNLNFNPEKLENKPVKMTVDKRVSNALLNHLLQGSVDLNNLAVDVEFEEISNNE